jgi:hypothetical protein
MNMKRIFFWSTVAAGVAAAVLMRKRGESIGKIALKAVTNPIGSFVSEVKTSRA